MFFAFPFDPAHDVHGVYQRVTLLMQGLGAISNHVDLLFFVPAHSPIDEFSIERARGALRQLLGTEVSIYLCPRRDSPRARATMRERFTKGFLPALGSLRRQPMFAPFCGPEQVSALGDLLERRPAVALVHDLRNMAAFLEWRGPLPPTVFDVDNIEHRVRLRQLLHTPAWPAERLRLGWLPATIWGEMQAYRLAERVFVCSDEDRRYLRRMGIRHTSVVPNAVTPPDQVPTEPGPHRLLFVGRLDYEPNAAGVEYLTSRIWPTVRASMPEAELWIAGAAPEGVAGYDSPQPGIHFLGFVENLERLYANVRIVTGPLQVGGGTRFKLIEAAAYGKAIVSTTVGAEGLLLEPEREILIRDSPDAFAAACIDLLRDDDRALALGTQAQERVRQSYSRTVVVQSIAAELRGIAGAQA